MTKSIPRLRMFAGPNGSGKSTIKSVINPELLGVYINPDEIEIDVRNNQFLDLQTYSVTTTSEEILAFFVNSPLLVKASLNKEAKHLRFRDNKLFFYDVGVDSYFASVAADFIRKKLIGIKNSFSFETVMSSPDKIDLLRFSQEQGYRNYLYYVATEDPDINISRVRNRVNMGGHSVPEDKIVTRYKRSLDLLMQAVQLTHRAYIFDNSSHEHIWLAEITNGRSLEMKTNLLPIWFQKSLWDKFCITKKGKPN